jgi:hypothetical protein
LANHMYLDVKTLTKQLAYFGVLVGCRSSTEGVIPASVNPNSVLPSALPPIPSSEFSQPGPPKTPLPENETSTKTNGTNETTPSQVPTSNGTTHQIQAA